ncbi:MAG: hypothetical protein ABI304_13165 [Rudaea sp.]
MNVKRNLFTGAIMAIAIAAALPALADEATVVVKKTTHHYVYYSGHDIYFAPDSKTYYWLDKGAWQSGTALPSEDQQFVNAGGVHIELDTDRPFERNDYVVAHYGKSPATRETTTVERSTADNGAASTTTTTTTTVKHNYVYYGDHDIYFAPDTKVYYWNADGTWKSGKELPADSQNYVRSGGVSIELDTARPYERNEYVIAHYRKNHDSDQKHEHDDDDQQ